MKRNQPSRITRITVTSLICLTTSTTLSCSGTPPDAANATSAAGTASAGNDKRWSQFEETNKRDRSVGASAFEKRQAQLAEKRLKASGKTGANAGEKAALPGGVKTP